MALSWSMRRQLMYYVVAAILLVVLAFVGYQAFFTRMPSCSDGIKNGIETGVDCGGSCSAVCVDAARLPSILWARSFPSQEPLHTAAAYIQNLNVGAGAKQVKYSFRLFDDKNALIAERAGVANIPPIKVIPIFETNIDVGNRTVARTLFEFTSVPEWERISADTLPVLRISDQELRADGMRLSARVVNDMLRDVRNVTIVVVVFDTNGVARAASQTLVPSIARQSSEPIVFTWPKGFEGVARAEITILPTF